MARRYKNLCRRVYASTDLYFVLCEEYRRRIERIVRASPADSKVRALTNPLAERPALELQKRKEVLYVGRLSYADKRVDRLLRIWRRVEADFPDWELKIVGDGSERANLERQAVKSRLQRVRFCGHSTCVEEHYATGAILCMTSSFEGWPLVLIEAQAWFRLRSRVPEVSVVSWAATAVRESWLRLSTKNNMPQSWSR
nr:glycosyltransferase [Alistipes timonensis]